LAFALKSYKDLRDVEGPVVLGVLAVSGEYEEEAIASCGQKNSIVSGRDEWKY
jgi:hypothetical protein